jgi:SNF2 family DNA or RNA helicase
LATHLTVRVDPKKAFKVVYSIYLDSHLGPVVQPYVVQLTSAGNLSLTHGKLHVGNAEAYADALDEKDFQALGILEKTTPEYLTRKHHKTGSIRPREFFNKKLKPEHIEKLIRPGLDAAFCACFELLKNKNWYRREGKNPIATKLEFVSGTTTALFHIRRNQDNTHYFITLKNNTSRIVFSQNNSLLLSKHPCWILVGDGIFQVEEGLDGKKLEPFLYKKFIAIPRTSEETYFRKFLIPLIEKHSVYAVGVDIETERHRAKPVLRITKLVTGQFGAVLYFRYGHAQFPYHTKKEVSVSMEKTEDSYVFKRIKRSLMWEGQKKEVLDNLGLVQGDGATFTLAEEKDEYGIYEWVNTNLSELESAGFEVVQDEAESYEFAGHDVQVKTYDEADWFDLHAFFTLGGYDIPFLKLRQYLVREERIYPLPNGKKAIIPLKWIEQFKGLAELSDSEEKIQIKKIHLGLVQDYLSPANSNLRIKKLNKLNPMRDDVPYPMNFKGTLRAYQKAGYEWLHFLWDNGFGGCLADDMGLGKTIQTLSFLQWRLEDTRKQEQQQSQPLHLLVLPNALVYNWVAEAKKFTPDLKLHKHIGTKRSKSTDRLRHYDVLVTTYGTLRNDIDLLSQIPFQVVVLDESQFIKNPKAQITRQVHKLQARLKLTLTGTPVENTINDLWSQMHFANSGLLGTYASFQKEYVYPIEKNGDVERTNRLRKIINPFVLRRTKEQVAGDLPEKIEQVIHCDMSEEQEELYEKTKADYRNSLLKTIEKIGRKKSRFHMLAGLTKLRQIANHPALEFPNFKGKSGKFETALDMLYTALESKHKVLVFSQFVSHLQIFTQELDKKRISYCYIDGSLSSKERADMVNRFQNQEDIGVFFISLKAGGYGLNLTAADYVYLLDPWWNPAAEQQAVDRTHRIGQDKKVFSYRFITVNSIEQKIQSLQARKQSLSDELIKEDESSSKILDIEDLESLFN